MNIGIIGYGNIGQIRHQKALEIFPDAKFMAYDPYIVDSPRVEIFPSAEAVITKSDCVFICTPNYLNAKHTIQSLRLGKHVFCEKPPALNYDELLEVEDEYSRHPDLNLIYGFNHRQYDSIQMMKALIDSNDTGKVLWMRGRYGKAIGNPNNSGWRSDPAKSGGGILLDQGIHMLDLMIYFGGPFDEVNAIVTNNLWNVEGIEDNAFVILQNNKDKVSASLHSTMIEWRYVFSLEVLMESGYLALNGLKTPSGSYGKEVLTICDDKRRSAGRSESTIIEFKNNNTWEKEVSGFFDGVMGTPKTNLPDALEVMKTIKEAYRGKR